jgi:hypothetical protein
MDADSSQAVSKKRSRSDEEPNNDPGPVATKRRATGTRELQPLITTPMGSTLVSAPKSPDIPLSLEWSSQFSPTCLFGEANNATTPMRKRIALFDLDGTLITSKSGARVPVESDDWKWLYQDVPIKLKRLHADG